MFVTSGVKQKDQRKREGSERKQLNLLEQTDNFGVRYARVRLLPSSFQRVPSVTENPINLAFWFNFLGSIVEDNL